MLFYHLMPLFMSKKLFLQPYLPICQERMIQLIRHIQQVENGVPTFFPYRN